MSRKDYYNDPTAPRANSIVPAASAIVTNKLGEILMHRRVDNDKWSLLGGAMQPGETISQTIIREIKEESGFDTEIEALIGIYSDPNHIIEYSDGEIRQQFSICFHCRIIAGHLKISSESKELKFFDHVGIEFIDMHPAQRLRINDYFYKISKNKEKIFLR